MTSIFVRTAATLLFCTVTAAASVADTSAKFAAGSVHAWTSADRTGRISAMGVSIKDSALNQPPADEVTLDLIPAGNISPFQFVEVDWHPHGHPPIGVYDKPHFDVHFYVISKAERDAIVPGPLAAAKPADGAVPEGYVTDNEVVPQMGVHYGSVRAPEFNKKPFSVTFLYGFYKGKLAFVEPMLTSDFLRTTRSYEAEIPLPARPDTHGRFPTRVRVVYNAGRQAHDIILDNMKQL